MIAYKAAYPKTVAILPYFRDSSAEELNEKVPHQKIFTRCWSSAFNISSPVAVRRLCAGGHSEAEPAAFATAGANMIAI
jgi:hypothetical protein